MDALIEEKIKQALKQTAINGEYDFYRFKAATQDLLTDYPQERKFYSRIADEKFWSICMRAKTEEASEAKEAESIAAKYLQDEYGITSVRAVEMSKYTVEAIFADSNGSSIEKRREETRRKISALERQSKSTTDEKVVHNAKEIVEKKSEAKKQEQQNTDDQPAIEGHITDNNGERKSIRKQVLICICIITALIATLPIAQVYDQKKEERESKELIKVLKKPKADCNNTLIFKNSSSEARYHYLKNTKNSENDLAFLAKPGGQITLNLPNGDYIEYEAIDTLDEEWVDENIQFGKDTEYYKWEKHDFFPEDDGCTITDEDYDYYDDECKQLKKAVFMREISSSK